MILPPQAGRFMLSARLDFRLLRPLWRVAVLDVKYELSIPQAAVRYGSQVDNIEGLEAALMPDDAYLIKFGPKLVGAMSPGDRQKVARCINQIHANDTGVLSPYMQQAVKYAESSAGMILALDLHHVVAPADAKARLMEWELLKHRDVDLDRVAEVLASIRGVMLGVTVTDKRHGAIRVDFDQDASVLQDFAKPLLLEVLGRHGLMIDDFQDWTAEVRGKMATRARVSTQERIQGNVEANHITQGIAESTAEVRRRMTEKYQVEF